jgi:hypothetical protein
MTAQPKIANSGRRTHGRDKLPISTPPDCGSQAMVIDQASRSIECIITEETQTGKNNR